MCAVSTVAHNSYFIEVLTGLDITDEIVGTPYLAILRTSSDSGKEKKMIIHSCMKI